MRFSFFIEALKAQKFSEMDSKRWYKKRHRDGKRRNNNNFSEWKCCVRKKEIGESKKIEIKKIITFWDFA